MGISGHSEACFKLKCKISLLILPVAKKCQRKKLINVCCWLQEFKFFNQTKIASFIDWNIYDQKIIDAWGWITLTISKYSGISDYSILDQKIIDGTSHLTQYVSSKLRKTQSGIIQNYLLGVLVVLVVIIVVINQI